MTGVASPCSSTSLRPKALTGASGSSLTSEPSMIGIHSSSSPTSVRIRRVLPWPRSPRSTMSCRRAAPLDLGTTVSSKPTMPGSVGSPAASRAMRLERISALTERGSYPLAASSPRVRAGRRGWGRKARHATTVRQDGRYGVLRPRSRCVHGRAAMGLDGSVPGAVRAPWMISRRTHPGHRGGLRSGSPSSRTTLRTARTHCGGGA